MFPSKMNTEKNRKQRIWMDADVARAREQKSRVCRAVAGAEAHAGVEAEAARQEEVAAADIGGAVAGGERSAQA